MANNRICLTCGKPYEYCGSCQSSLTLPVWKNIFDTENCKTVFEIVSDYAQNVITKEVAKTKLLNCDLSHSFKGNIKKYIDEIIIEEKIEQIIETEKTEPITPKTKSSKKKVLVENENND